MLCKVDVEVEKFIVESITNKLTRIDDDVEFCSKWAATSLRLVDVEIGGNKKPALWFWCNKQQTLEYLQQNIAIDYLGKLLTGLFKRLLKTTLPLEVQLKGNFQDAKNYFTGSGISVKDFVSYMHKFGKQIQG